MRNALLAVMVAVPAALLAQAPAPAPVPAPDTGIVRGLYVNRFAAQSAKKMRSLIALADSTEINALVIDIKDEFGLNYTPTDPSLARNAGKAGVIPNIKALLDTLRAHRILAVARIVVFKDSVTARVNPEWTIRKQDGSLWRDKKGLAWVNPYHAELWDYNIKVAEDAVRLGFGEVQFDYIRFPEPYKSLPVQVFPAQGAQTKEQALAEFLKLAHSRLAKLGVRTTADIFGLVTTVPGALEVGQQWEHLAPVTDVLLPMVYPSHYPHGSFDLPRPNAEPYKVVHAAVQRAHERDAKLGLAGERVRPWLQAFTLGSPAYGAAEVKAQKQAVYDAGYDGWVLWNPGSHYDAVRGALERTRISHKRPFTPPVPSAASGAPVRKVARP
ncbi:MAG: putative glycoside hydrolase [Gemmatimonadales bacterium]